MNDSTQRQAPTTPPPMDNSESDIWAIAQSIGGTVYDGARQ